MLSWALSKPQRTQTGPSWPRVLAPAYPGWGRVGILLSWLCLSVHICRMGAIAVLTTWGSWSFSGRLLSRLVPGLCGWLRVSCCYPSSCSCLSHGSWAFPSPGSPSHFHRDFRSARGSASHGSGRACPVPFVEVEFNFSLSRESSAPACPLSCSHQLENELWELSPWSRNAR